MNNTLANMLKRNSVFSSGVSKDKSKEEMRGFIEKMLSSRMPFYTQAHITVSGDLEHGAEEILEKLGIRN